MRRPLHAIQIHPFFKHLPQRRQFAQLADFGFNQLGGELDVFFAGHTPEGDAQR